MTVERVADLKGEYPDVTLWDREMEIDPNARSGKRVFPEFGENIHRTPAFRLDKYEWTTYLGCDPHPRRAHSFLWLAVNAFGEMTIPWYWWPEEINEARARGEYGPNKKHRLLISEYAQALKDIEGAGLFPPNVDQVMDVAGRNFNASETHSFFDAYRDEDVYFRAAKKNIGFAGYSLISKVLAPTTHKDEKGNEVTRPLLTIMDGGGDNEILVKQIKYLRWKEWKGTVVDKDAPDQPEEKDRHLVDCLSYILLEHPELVPTGPVAQYPVQYKRIGW